MKDRLIEIKHNIKSGRLRLQDLNWLVETLEKQAEEIEHLRTVDKAYQAMRKAL